jgi:hypothetical protein
MSLSLVLVLQVPHFWFQLALKDILGSVLGFCACLCPEKMLEYFLGTKKLPLYGSVSFTFYNVSYRL